MNGANDIFIYRQTKNTRRATQVGAVCNFLCWCAIMVAAVAFVYDKLAQSLLLKF